MDSEQVATGFAVWPSVFFFALVQYFLTQPSFLSFGMVTIKKLLCVSEETLKFGLLKSSDSWEVGASAFWTMILPQAYGNQEVECGGSNEEWPLVSGI